MRPDIYVDTECFPNYWLFKCCDDYGQWWQCELRGEHAVMQESDRAHILTLFNACCVYTFNGRKYDIPMIRAALGGLTAGQLKTLNDAIIVGGLQPFQITDAGYPQWQGAVDHVDMYEVVPGVRIGLKTYMARMHSQSLQDLPYPPDTVLTTAQMDEVAYYCGNDIIGTRDLRHECEGRLALRRRMSEKYGVDMRSKSDAQMSEATMAAVLGYKPQVPYIPSGTRWQVQPAPWLSFATPYMQDVFAQVCSAVFEFNRKDPGEVLPDGTKSGVALPEVLKRLRVQLPGSTTVYKFGIGGLHSTETGRVLGEDMHLWDSDVASYYPRLIILLKLLPPELQAIFESILTERLQLKAAKNPDEGGLKIVVNGGFGKLWSKFSFLCNPYAGSATTINGQLSLLMLIERLHLAGIPTHSANTDGIVTSRPPALQHAWASTMQWWQRTTGFELEHKAYRKLVQRDVNNYIALDTKNNVKLKGVFAKSGLLSGMQGIHPDRDVARDACVAYVQHGTPVEETIAACNDIRKFILTRKVAGGATWREQYMGVTARWYYATDGEAIRNGKGDKVASSDGAWPAQTLPDCMPENIDRARYVAYARELLSSCGVVV
jgi:hypothetical protein